MELLIYVDQISERLVYTMQFIFDQHGLDIQLTNDKVRFQSCNSPKMAYSDWNVEDEKQLKPAALLFEETIDMDLKVDGGLWNNELCLAFNGIVDPIASIFYCLSRYEEYTISRRDKHGRFDAKNSILFQLNCLHKQQVEHWVHAFVFWSFPDAIQQLKVAQKTVFVPSFDIDNTFAFQWKDGWRKWVSIAKDRFQNNQQRLTARKLVLTGEQPDPYDSFEYIRAIADKHPETRVFWLLGDLAEFDKNISWLDPRHQALIRSFQQSAHIGLHPSYASNGNELKLKTETNRLAAILGVPPNESRQHFLKLAIPFTYQKLIHVGFKRDFTMGYADQIGFRAGTAHPFFFFDLLTNEATDLEIWPFAYMDGTLKTYQGWTIQEAERQIQPLIEEVKKYGGIFCCIWHNETIAEANDWKGWKQVFEFTLKQFTSND